MPPQTKPSSDHLGALYRGQNKTDFRVWAPDHESVQIRFVGSKEKLIPMKRTAGGYHVATVDNARPGTRYFYRLSNGKDRPDPASRFQPEGVHGPSEIVDTRFDWNDRGWGGIRLSDYVIYELHIGTFTPEGTFDAVVTQLERLRELGITAIELMPIAQFPGTRNWGYDGVSPFAAQNSYGGIKGLQRLVDACHQLRLAVILDVVYNHLGPEGNYLGEFGPYFTDRYKTPWGLALNFDGAHSDHVRNFFVQNALWWVDHLHIDALRLDAVHAIVDHTAYPFLQEVADAVHERAEKLNRRVYVIAESDLNDPRVIHPTELGGWGYDSQWSDDFHHSLHTLLTGEQSGYYSDFGAVSDLARVMTRGYVYTGQSSKYRGRRFGAAPRVTSGSSFIVCSQNHDQVGNRMTGDRLAEKLTVDQIKLGAATVLLSPFVPMLFMGEEYGERAPFQYFMSHSDEELVEAVRKGRREEFASFGWKGEVPDPADEKTFARSKINVAQAKEELGGTLQNLYRYLISLRKKSPALSSLDLDSVEAIGFERERVLFVKRRGGGQEMVLIFNFGKKLAKLSYPVRPGQWKKRCDSSDTAWLGRGSTRPETIESDGALALSMDPASFVIYERVEAGE